MVVAPIDAKLVNCEETRSLLEQYRLKFGEPFLMFNYVDFPGEAGKPAGQMYREALIKALESDEPCRMVSHRYDIIDH